MREAAVAVVVLLAASIETSAQGAYVFIRAATAAISVSGGATQVTATLYDASGNEIDGLIVEREGKRTHIVLLGAVKPGARIEARVPGITDLRVEGSNGGPVTVRGVTGQLEIASSNAGIVLERIGGTVLASTSNGSIEATLHSIAPGLPMSFLTSNGRIDVTFPVNLKANLHMESDSGPITTEFPLARIGGEPIERKIMRGGRLRTITHGAVNGGGPDITIRTENAPIVIRKHQ